MTSNPTTPGHATTVHGALSPRVVGIVAAIAFVFGTAVLAAEIFDTDKLAHDDDHSALVVPFTEAGIAQTAGVA
jgi:hypothetical protein